MKTLRKLAVMAVATGMVFNLSSCNKEEKEEPPVNNDALSSYELIGTQTLDMAGVDAKLYFMESPFVGYNSVAVRLMEKGTSNMVENATVRFLPMMDMGTHKHSAPFSNPSFNVDMDAYMGSSTFIMPGGMMGSWTFGVIVERNGMAADTAVFNINVAAKTEARLFNFLSEADSTTTYFVALKEPSSPKIGLNDFEIMVYKRESMMSFPAVTNLKVEIEPEMPSMGHGSPKNVNPVHIEDGLYRGKVNFTMSGYWKVNIKLMDDNDAVIKSNGYFDITFQ